VQAVCKVKQLAVIEMSYKVGERMMMMMMSKDYKFTYSSGVDGRPTDGFEVLLSLVAWGAKQEPRSKGGK
jgi:hypothetical protein